MDSFNLDPIRKRSIAEEISERILKLLRDRKLHPGDKLPPERELADMLGVSRPSLREALRALSLMNIIEIRHGDGTYVSSLDPDQLFDHLEFVFDLDESTLVQLFEARKVVEVGCVALAATHITSDELALLDSIVAQSAATVEDADAFLAADLALHKVVIEASNNPMLIRFMASISQLGMVSRRITGSSAAVRKQSIQDHRAIVAALKAGNPEAASQAMLEHLNNVEKSLEHSRLHKGEM
jgi:GntR family transcriptional repressor for pyruvate dehydrogenase complex